MAQSPPTHRHGHDVGESLYLHRHTPIHQLPAHVKIVTLILFVFIVVATPRTIVWAFGAYFAMMIGLLAAAQIPARLVGPRMLVEVPFVLFAALMPITGPDPRVTVAGLSLSVPGLWAAWGIIAKGTIGVLAAILLAATTTTADLLDGLRALRVPPVLVQIASFMARYVHVVGAESHRMAVARVARCWQPAGPRSWPVLGQSAGTLFIRSYERGERVHLAMLSRGYTGIMPDTDPLHATARQWVGSLALPASAALVCATALVWQ